MARHRALQMFGRSGNPALKSKAFAERSSDFSTSEVMTLSGTVNKTGLYLLLCFMTAAWTWNQFYSSGDPSSVMGYLIFGTVGGLIAALVTIFKPTSAPISAPIYALLEGFAIGGISAMFESMYPGIVIQAVGLTFFTLASLLMAYKTGIIKPTENFRLMIFAATSGIMLLYLLSFIMSFFGSGIGFIHSNGPMGIIFSLVVVAIAALNLVLDFDFIEQASEQGAPKYLEAYGAFSLLVTLIWLYLEILRLLSKIYSRN
jgi:uncharacterized YccA/Bax inhibitor family protein|tara:strand:+ start:2996 stop:3772 length:777 start_codon:yes stop_codon:yes gene_type:complete